MHVGEFPAAAANSLIQGYCDDFISLAALLAQTLEQVSMRGINIAESNEGLQRIESGMRDLADAIQDQIRSGGSRPNEGSLLAGVGSGPSKTPDLPSGLEGYASYLSHEATDSEDVVSDDIAHAAHEDPPHEDPPPAATGDNDPGLQFDGRLEHGLDEDFVEAMMDPRVTPSYPAPDQAPDPSKRASDPLDEFGEPAEHTPPLDRQAPAKRNRHRPSNHSEAFRPPAKATPADLTSEDLREQPDGARSEAAKPQREPARPDKRRPMRQPPTTAGQALKGTNHTMPVLSVFQFIERMRKSGVMTVKILDEVLTFEFDNGCVQACKSTCQDKGDRLGDLLIEQCNCDPKPITDILYRTKGKSKLQLGEMILQSGCATNGQIMDALETQVRRRFSRACKATDAIYQFVDCTPDRTDGRVRITPMELAFESSWTPDL